MLDDITDNAYTRRDNLCWYKLPTVSTSHISISPISIKGVMSHGFGNIDDHVKGEPVTKKCLGCLCQVGLSAINDGVLLKCHVQAIIKRYFKEKFYFLELMELWNEVVNY